MFGHALSSGNVATKILASFATVSDVAATVVLDEQIPAVGSRMLELQKEIETNHNCGDDTHSDTNCKAIIIAPPRTEKTMFQVLSTRKNSLVC